MHDMILFVDKDLVGLSTSLYISVTKKVSSSVLYLVLVVVGTVEQCFSCPTLLVPSISLVVVDVPLLVGFVDVEDVVVVVVVVVDGM